MPLSLTSDEHAALVKLACRAFRKGHQSGMYARKNAIVQPRAGEVIMVSHFCLSMMEAARVWNVELQRMGKPYELTVSTVFTHQRPYVRFKSATKKAGCEMADMLVVVVDRTLPDTRATAILLQAKLSDDHHVELMNDSEKKQFELFEGHPVFDMRAGGPQGVFLPRSTASAGLRYGITGAAHFAYGGVHVRAGRWQPHAWYNSPVVAGTGPIYRVGFQECIAHLLVDMLAMNAGSAFTPSAAVNTAAPSTWDDVINYLLKTTYQQALNAANPANAGRTQRGAEVIMTGSTSGPETFLASLTAPSDSAGPVRWLTSIGGASANEGVWSPSDQEKLEMMLQRMVRNMEEKWKEQRNRDDGGDEQNPPVDTSDSDGGVSTIVIEIVNSEVHRWVE
jgi:hypothetical protein